ncbi:MAG: response regulator transcription factor [Deltaproteobacteria bacterium]|nr:response regulator transcription factor [Deltaproteobacteria bacterium]
MKTILIIEDEQDMVLGLSDALEFEGYRAVAASTGRQGVVLFKAEKPDLVILDLMLPDTNGYTVCEELRRLSRTVPVLILSARSQESDKIRGLDAGADDFVAKPFALGELIARIRAILRRADHARATPDTVQIGESQVHLAGHLLLRKGRESALTFYEVETLKLLLERAGQVVTRDEILDKVWGVSAINARAVDNLVVKLRKKIEATPDAPRHILTVHGVGYKLVC